MPDDTADGRHELAYRMAVDHLAAQFAALDELRGRVGVVLSGAGVATGFLAGQALNTSRGFPVAAGFGCGAALLLMIVSAYILWPREWSGLTQNAKAVLEDIATVPERATGDYYAATAGYAVKAASTNDARLKTLYRWFSASLVLLVIDFAGWIIVLARN
jgi:hypothetical protein